MQRTLVVIGVVAAALLLLAVNSLFIVPVGRQALLLQLGEYRDSINEGTTSEEGLHFKWPLIQNVVYYDKRNLGYELDEEEIIAADQQRLIVDAIVRYRIVDPLQFFRAAGTIQNGEAQLSQRMTAAMRGELGKVDTPDIISGQRARLMGQIQQTLQATMTSFGVEIIDVRIRRADLPAANSARVFERMKAELNQRAALYRAEGEENFNRITSEADRQVTVILADANEQAQTIRGQGDAQRNAIYANAFQRDPDFFSFYRSMQAYENSIEAGTPLVLSPDSDFFRYFGAEGGR
jgi:membrane protease subunit HflC